MAKQYAHKLIAEGVVDAEAGGDDQEVCIEGLNAIYDESKQSSQKYEVQELSAVNAERTTGLVLRLRSRARWRKRISKAWPLSPPTFHLHPKLQGFVDKRKEILHGASIDWATGEALAFGSLVLEGTPVRLSGQDSGRGTFSQRHLEFSDSESGKKLHALQHLARGQARFKSSIASLSEYAVMGFEFGYSVADP